MSLASPPAPHGSGAGILPVFAGPFPAAARAAAIQRKPSSGDDAGLPAYLHTGVVTGACRGAPGAGHHRCHARRKRPATTAAETRIQSTPQTTAGIPVRAASADASEAAPGRSRTSLFTSRSA